MAEGARGQAPATGTAGVRTTANRAVLVIFGILIIAVLAVIFLIYKPELFPTDSSNQSAYVVLFKNMEFTDAAAVVESLKAQGVKDYKLEDDGRTVLIPRRRKNEVVLKIAKEGILPTGGTVGFEIFDKGGALGATDFDKQVKFSRAISGELSRSIARIYGVEEARVQVVIPARQLFATVRNPVLASVFIKIREGELLSPLQVSGIVSLVASSVEELRTENVTVVDYFGRVLSSDRYPKDYERLLAMMTTQQKEQNKGTKSVITGLTESSAQKTDTSKFSVRDFFDVYRKTDRDRKEKQEKDLMRGLMKKGMSADELFAAKLKFKQKYEDLLEKNVQLISAQFFPQNAVKVKINVELNNLRVAETTVSPNSLVSRITTMILLDENNKEVFLTPEIREALMKSVAAVIGYVKGRDLIDLRWAPMVSTYGKSLLSGVTSTEQVKKTTGKKPLIPAEIIPKMSKANQTKQNQDKSAMSSQQNWLQKIFTLIKKDNYLYFGSGVVILILLIVVVNFLTGKKKDRQLVPESAQKSVFETESKASEADFKDLKTPPIEKFRELASRSPEKIAGILEKWFREDEVTN